MVCDFKYQTHLCCQESCSWGGVSSYCLSLLCTFPVSSSGFGSTIWSIQKQSWRQNKKRLYISYTNQPGDVTKTIILLTVFTFGT